MCIVNIDIEPEFDEYDDPDGSVWVIAVDYLGRLHPVEPPNVWEGFYEDWPDGSGWPEDTVEVGPGLYRVTASFAGGKDPDTFDAPGDPWWEFTPVKWEPLWIVDGGAS